MPGLALTVEHGMCIDRTTCFVLCCVAVGLGIGWSIEESAFVVCFELIFLFKYCLRKRAMNVPPILAISAWRQYSSCVSDGSVAGPFGTLLSPCQ